MIKKNASVFWKKINFCYYALIHLLFSVFMRTYIPEHLMNEYQIYTGLIAGVRILAKAIEECINEGLLVEPENKVGAEGVLMIVEK